MTDTSWSDRWMTFDRAPPDTEPTGHESVTIYLSDNTRLAITLTNYGWGIMHWKDVDGGPILNDGDLLPYRSGAIEWAFAWIKRQGLTSVPTDEQRARIPPSQQRLTADNGLTVIDPPGSNRKPAAAPDNATLAIAQQLEAMRIAGELDALMKGTGNGTIGS